MRAASQWLGLVSIAAAAVGADQLTKQVVASDAHARRGGADRRAVLDPPRPQLRDRVRALLERHVGRDRTDGARGASGCSSSSRAPARGTPCCRLRSASCIGGSVVEPRRPRPARSRHRLPRSSLLAGVQPRRRVHRRRRRHPARRALAGRRPSEAPAPAALATLRFRAPEAASASTASVAGRPEVGSRAVAERLITGGAVLVDGELARQEPPARGRGGASSSSCPPSASAARGGVDATCTSPGRTSTCSSSTSRRASSSIRRAGHATGTLVHGLLAHDAARRRRAERPGIVHRLDRDTSGLLVVARSDEAHRRLQAADPRARLVERRVPRARARARSARARAGSRRRSAATARDTDAHSLDTPTPREAVTRFEVDRGARPAARCSTSGSRPAARTRSASTSRRSSLPVVGDPVYGIPATSGSSGSSCMPPGSRSPPVHGASGSTSSRRCPTTSPPRSSARARASEGLAARTAADREGEPPARRGVDRARRAGSG